MADLETAHATLDHDGLGAPSFTAWTPALSATTTPPTLGSGSTAEGRYFRFGNFVFAYGAIGFGTSGTNAGNGTYTVSLPVAIRTPSNFDGNIVGHGRIFDSSTSAVRAVTLAYQSDTTVNMNVIDGSSSVTHSAPWAWAASDVIMVSLTYETDAA